MKKTCLVFVMVAAAVLSCSRREREEKGNEAASNDGHRILIQNKGSDTLVNVAQSWAEEYAKVKSNVAVAVSGGGTGTGISALINGTVDIANASRELKDKEIETAKKNNIFPKKHIVGYDALAVFLHKDNPLSEMTLSQLSAIYADGGAFNKWSDLGIKVPGCESDEIVRVSRQNNSGTYEYFKEAVFGEGKEYKLGSRDMHGSKDVADLVDKTPCAIGYSGLAYATPNIKMPCIKKDDASPCIAPSVETALNHTYTISRPLFMYTNGEPTAEIKSYLDWILSDAGQCIIQKQGYAPIKKVICN